MLATAASAKPFPKNRLARHLLDDTEGDYDLVPTGDVIPTTGGGDIATSLIPTGDISQLVTGSLAGAVGAVAPIVQPIVSAVSPVLDTVSSCAGSLVSDVAGALTPQGGEYIATFIRALRLNTSPPCSSGLPTCFNGH